MLNSFFFNHRYITARSNSRCDKATTLPTGPLWMKDKAQGVRGRDLEQIRELLQLKWDQESHVSQPSTALGLY